MSASYRSNNSVGTLDLQLQHNWKNPEMALEYIADSEPHREKMASAIQGIDINKPQASTSQQALSQPAKRSRFDDEIEVSGSIFKIANNGGTINITINK